MIGKIWKSTYLIDNKQFFMFNKYGDIQVYVDFDIICFLSLSWLFVLFFVFMAWSEGLFYLELMIVLGTFYLYF